MMKWIANGLNNALDICLLKQMINNRVGSHSISFGVEIGDDAVPEYRGGDGADVVGADAEAAMQRCACLRGKHDVLTRPRAGAPTDVLADHFRGLGTSHARLPNQR
jgi:hypothetical protein